MRRWFRPWLVIYLILVPGRQAMPWIADHLHIVVPLLLVAAIASALVYALHRPAPAPAVEGPHPGVMILEVKDLAPARCLTCREGLRGDVVRCGRCRTPHHRDCFRYVGACSVYACGGRRAA